MFGHKWFLNLTSSDHRALLFHKRDKLLYNVYTQYNVRYSKHPLCDLKYAAIPEKRSICTWFLLQKLQHNLLGKEHLMKYKVGYWRSVFVCYPHLNQRKALGMKPFSGIWRKHTILFNHSVFSSIFLQLPWPIEAKIAQLRILYSSGVTELCKEYEK